MTEKEREALAHRIVKLIHADLNDRRGLHIDSCDEEIQKDIRHKHTQIVMKALEKV